MNPTIYIETSVVSYLVARPSRNARVASNQELTREWWQTRRERFELAQVTREALDLAAALVAGAGVPKKANEDALHIAIAACNGLDYLLTWNSHTSRME